MCLSPVERPLVGGCGSGEKEREEQTGRLAAKIGPKADSGLRYGPPGLSVKILRVLSFLLHHQSFLLSAARALSTS